MDLKLKLRESMKKIWYIFFFLIHRMFGIVFNLLSFFILKLKRFIIKCATNLVDTLIILIGLFTLIATIIFALWNINLQQKFNAEDKLPFFKYSYDGSNKIFHVEGGDNLDITKIDWIFAGRWMFEEDKFTLKNLNFLDTDLSWYEIRDAYGETLVNTMQEWGKDMMECEFFRFTADGIPVMVSVTYDSKEKSRLENKDLLLITRMDTNKPYPRVVLRGVNESKEIENFFNKNLRQVRLAIEYFKKNIKFSNEEYKGGLKQSPGKCGFLMNQPVEGY